MIGTGTEGQSVALTFFNDFEARTVAAIAERIIPGGDGEIGATDAGVVYYIDRAVAGFSISLQKIYRLGLRELEAYCRRKYDKSLVELNAGAPGRSRPPLPRSRERGGSRGAQAYRRGGS